MLINKSRQILGLFSFSWKLGGGDGRRRSREEKPFSEIEALMEARRCMKCASAPCIKDCPTSIDIPRFIHMIENKNYYGAGKVILSANPMGLTCGSVCPQSKLCGQDCNAIHTEGGAIKIAKLQEFAMKVVKGMNVRQRVHPSVDQQCPQLQNKRIGLIGCGPASISCASFLGRLGYRQIDIYEQNDYGGGLSMNEIPQHRLEREDVEFEIGLMKDLGVNVIYGKKIEQLMLNEMKYDSIFIGSGLPQANRLSQQQYSNVCTSKEFLPEYNVGMKFDGQSNVQFKGGHVLILGLGDTAIDCGRCALRSGATQVTIAFREQFNQTNAHQQAINIAMSEGINFLANHNPIHYNSGGVGGDHHVQSITFHAYDQQQSQQSQQQQQQQQWDISCDYVITAFGSHQSQFDITNVNKQTLQNQSYPHLFYGGDILKVHNLVDAVSHGKQAAQYIHQYLSQSNPNHLLQPSNQPFTFPPFHTNIDQVDISTKLAGYTLSNPFGLASAPPTTSYQMIDKAFSLGWQFAVIKTFVLDQDAITNVSPRIVKSNIDPTLKSVAYTNIELISEKYASYWVQGAQDIKAKHPDKLLIASVMAKYDKNDWVQLIQMCNQAKFDIVELNLSGNHGMPSKGMGKACGERPEILKQITQWVVEIANMPVFVKLSPNSNINDDLALAAMEGGATGVTTTNSMHSLQNSSGALNPYPAVGSQSHTSFGGMAGAPIRPIALRIASSISQQPAFKGEIMASGGIISSLDAFSFFYFSKAKSVQIGSAVQEYGFNIIEDLTTGLKALLYVNGRKDLIEQGWVGQSPPIKWFENQYVKQSNKVEAQSDILSIESISCQGIKHFTDIPKMDTNAQLFPEIDKDLCVKCGRCFTACEDAGYQAIDFVGNQYPNATTKCTGCGLCQAVCPIPGALTYVPRIYDYKPTRGTP